MGVSGPRGPGLLRLPSPGVDAADQGKDLSGSSPAGFVSKPKGAMRPNSIYLGGPNVPLSFFYYLGTWTLKGEDKVLGHNMDIDCIISGGFGARGQGQRCRTPCMMVFTLALGLRLRGPDSRRLQAL